MTRLSEVGYQVVALLAMLAYLLIVLPAFLVTLALSIPPGAELSGLALKAIAVVVYFGLGYLGLRASIRKSWWVVVVPIVAIVLLYLLIVIGHYVVDWYLNVGY